MRRYFRGACTFKYIPYFKTRSHRSSRLLLQSSKRMSIAAPRWFTRTYELVSAVTLGPTNRAWRITKSLTICICPPEKTRPIFTKVIIVLRTTNGPADLFSWTTDCDEGPFGSAPLKQRSPASLEERSLLSEILSYTPYHQNIHHRRRTQGTLDLGPLLRIQMM